MRLSALLLASCLLASVAQAQIVTTPNLPSVTTPSTGDFLTVAQPCVTSSTGYCSRKATLGQVGSLFPSGTSGITQLTGDVTTASGTGSQTATIAPGSVTGAKLYSTAVRDSLGYTPATTDLTNYTGTPSTTRTALNAASRTLGDVTGIQNTVTMTGQDSRAQNFGNAFHTLLMNDTLTMPSGQETNFYQGLFMQDTVGAGHTGERNGLWSRILVQGSNAVPNAPHNYAAVVGESQLQAPLYPGHSYYGQIFGGNFIAQLTSGASPNGEAAVNVSAAEFDVIAQSPVEARTMLQFDANSSTYQGSVTDEVIQIGGGKWKQGIVFSNYDLTTGATPSSGAPVPLDPTVGQAIAINGAQSFKDFINADSATLSGHAFTFESGSVDAFKSGSDYVLALRTPNAKLKLGSNSAVGTPQIVFNTAGDSTVTSLIQASGGTKGTANSGAVGIIANTITVDAAAIRPSAANSSEVVGSSAQPFYSAYFQVAPQTTSDRRLKTPARDADLAKLARALREVRMHAYRLNADHTQRIRFGVYAQELVGALTKVGLDWRRYAFVEHDQETDRWSVNYVELQNAKDMLAEAGLLTVH